MTLFPGVVFSEWYGGVGPSLVTIALGMLAAVYFWIPPRYTFTVADSGDLVGRLFALFLLLFSTFVMAARARANEALRREIAERTQAEAQLRRSEQELSDFFENASVGLHFVGPDGVILRVNQTELDLLGYRFPF